jgi:hypothetical protein
MFLFVVTKPLSIKYPFSTFLGFKRVIFLSLSRSTLYCLKVKSSIVAPLREIEPTMFSFSNLILLSFSKASFLVILEKFSF